MYLRPGQKPKYNIRPSLFKGDLIKADEVARAAFAFFAGDIAFGVAECDSAECNAETRRYVEAYLYNAHGVGSPPTDMQQPAFELAQVKMPEPTPAPVQGPATFGRTRPDGAPWVRVPGETRPGQGSEGDVIPDSGFPAREGGEEGPESEEGREGA